ncbi:MAG: prepilin-type N-terminal cleavage/methylation domain-containing protein [Candidatus Falkowbacteria bacterium]
MIKKYKKNLPAFSLLEVIVVLIIVSVGLVGVVNLMAASLRTQNSNRDTLVAYDLAQEGLELIRNVRDTNWRNGAAWNQYITGDVNGTKYKVDFAHFQPQSVAGIDETLLQFSSTTNQYLYDASSTDTIFHRLITITANGSVSSTVTCLVEWNDRGDTRRFELQTELYDWK